ncbi:MAG TPA: hypothetical protein VMW10_05095 [Alphaproteobacteria bacterium]|nr:hypothetical protein [Alphaproteobacteria bacterium]
MFELIQCTPKPPKPSKRELYCEAYYRKIRLLSDNLDSVDVTQIMSIAFMGVKAFSLLKDKEEDINSLELRFRQMGIVKSFMSYLTPIQLMNTFPIRKEYDGDKYECKDYFYTKSKLDELNQDNPIGDKLDDLLWDYMNHDLQMFSVSMFGLMSNIMRSKGEPGIMERFSADFGIPLYYSDKEDRYITGPVQVKKVGEEYCYDDSEAKTVKRARPKHIQLVNP